MELRVTPKILLAACYRAAYLLHHALFLKPGRPLKNSKLVVVGSYRAGGAGKTPFCLWLAKQLAEHNHTVSVLCHSYAFDELRMYKSILSDFIDKGLVKVVGTSNRYRTAQDLDSRASSEFILCDDGFEDSRLHPEVIFRLDWEDEPNRIQQLIPAGKFRSLSRDHQKDNAMTVTLRCNGQTPDLSFKTESITGGSVNHFQVSQGIAVCGLGDPDRFIRTIENAGILITKTIIRPDHDRNFYRTIQKTIRQHPKENLIISEKDSFRLPKKLLLDSRLFIVRQSCQPSRQSIEKIVQVLA